MTTFSVAVAVVLGALIGSFANVVIYRLPEGASVVAPPSHCPRCGRRLRPWELVPVLSWLAQRGRCRGCDAWIPVRYALVETITAAGFGLIAWRWPLQESMAAPLLALGFTVLVIASFIDLDTFELPDVLTLPGTVVMVLAAWAYPREAGLPTPLEAAIGAAVGAGVLTWINRLGALALRRFRDTRERLWPIGFDQVNLAAFGGALGGLAVGFGLGAASLLANLTTRRTVRVPEPIVWGGWAVALAISGATVGPIRALAGSAVATGTLAFVGAVYWWLDDLRTRGPARPVPSEDARAQDGAARGAAGHVDPATHTQAEASSDEEPVAMGFGDVKLAALLGAVLGWERLLVGLFLAVLVGAVGGLIGRAINGGRLVPFGPYLAVGGVLALAFGDALIQGYLRLLGIG